MNTQNQPQSEPTIQLSGDLPPIHSAEFGDFLAQWHADHNGGENRQPKHTKSGHWVALDRMEMSTSSDTPSTVEK